VKWRLGRIIAGASPAADGSALAGAAAMAETGGVTELAGFILIPYGVIGSYRATDWLRRARLPQADCAALALLGLALVLGGLGLLLGSPAGVVVVGVLAVWRALALYNARLLRGRLRRRDLWPGAAGDLCLSALILFGSR